MPSQGRYKKVTMRLGATVMLAALSGLAVIPVRLLPSETRAAVGTGGDDAQVAGPAQVAIARSEPGSPQAVVAPAIQYLDPSLAPDGAIGRATGRSDAQSVLSHEETSVHNPIYASMLAGLRVYREVWSRLPQLQVPATAALHAGSSGPAVNVLRRRLGVQAADNTPFSVALEEKVRAFQRVHALPPTGVADGATIAALNRGSAHYEAIILANLERARWLPREMGDKFVLVNTAAARLIGYEHDAPALEMKVALGSSKRPTPALADKIETIVLDPSWYVPPHLVQSIIAPKVLEKGLAYLNENGFVVLSDWSDTAVEADPSSVDWRAVRDGRAYARVRQKPGPANPMGDTKFMFPNRLGIYLHDTPNHAVFAKEDRYVSNGCVRVEKAAELARFLVGEPMPADGSEMSREIVLKGPVPVITAHFTFWWDGHNPTFHKDVYGRDHPLIAKLELSRP
ncbi:L,D-transpeptidase family protein [Novosphingobium sp. M1R2S20]|uniref:L,D-transpeptidase family protein n=1 Tax=Novosphingobium rhizovicinum TaxID=3228928 RepID=A0ABV3RFY8_9SPHN